jgi:hypothetical protein
VVDDEQFAQLIAGRTAMIPGVLAVTLGGSRAQGEHRPDSDWDFGLYYRGRLDPDNVRALGWVGTVFAPGERGGGVMIGGAWLTVEGRRVDLHSETSTRSNSISPRPSRAGSGSSGCRSTWPASPPTSSSVSWRSPRCWSVHSHGQSSRRRCVSRRPGSGQRPRGCRSTTPRRSTQRGVMRWAARGARPGGGRGRARPAGRPGRVGLEREADRGARRPGQAHPAVRAAGQHAAGAAWRCRGGPRDALRARRLTHRSRGPWCRESGSSP